MKNKKIIKVSTAVLLCAAILYYLQLFLKSDSNQQFSALTSIILFILTAIFAIYQINKNREISIETTEFSQKREALIKIGHEIIDLNSSFNYLENEILIIYNDYKYLLESDYSYDRKKELGIVKNPKSTISFTQDFFKDLSKFYADCYKIKFELSMNNIDAENEIFKCFDNIVEKINKFQKNEYVLINQIRHVLYWVQEEKALDEDYKNQLKSVIESTKSLKNCAKDLHNLSNKLDDKIKNTINKMK